ncbi:MAG: hypothetical protein IJV50_02415, partial [Lachnospiraceae bacterium]|nr:hypothetical protein [Lachnospiraceae bacterium]
MSLRRIAAMVLGVAAAASIGTCVWIQSHVDREPPELIIGNILQGVTEEVTDEDLLVDVTAKDKRDGDLTDQVMVAERALTEEEMEVVYAVTDAAGNVTLKRRALPLTDEIIMASGEKETEEESSEEETESSSVEETETETETEESTEVSTEESIEESIEESTEESSETSVEEESQPESVSEPEEPETSPEESSAEETAEETTEETVPVETADPAIPVIRLKQNTVTLPAGTPFEYASYIESVTDDKDDQYQLYQHLVVTGYYDVRTPGSYPLQYWVTDTDRHES